MMHRNPQAGWVTGLVGPFQLHVNRGHPTNNHFHSCCTNQLWKRLLCTWLVKVHHAPSNLMVGGMMVYQCSLKIVKIFQTLSFAQSTVSIILWPHCLARPQLAVSSLAAPTSSVIDGSPTTTLSSTSATARPPSSGHYRSQYFPSFYHFSANISSSSFHSSYKSSNGGATAMLRRWSG